MLLFKGLNHALQSRIQTQVLMLGFIFSNPSVFFHASDFVFVLELGSRSNVGLLVSSPLLVNLGALLLFVYFVYWAIPESALGYFHFSA